MRFVFKTLFYNLGLFLLFSCGSDYRNGTYTVGVDVAWYGVDLMGQQTSVTGFSQDLLKEIGKIKKMKIAFLPANWDVLIPNLKSGSCDAIFSPLHPYIFNQTTFDFSSPYLLTGPVLVLPADSSLRFPDQLNGKEIAVLSNRDAELLAEKNSGILIRPYDNIPQALIDVAAGTIDGALVDVIIASSYCQNLYAGKLKITTPPLNDQGLRLLTNAQKAEPLMRAFQTGLEEMKKNGSYDALLKKWSLGQGAP